MASEARWRDGQSPRLVVARVGAAPGRHAHVPAGVVAAKVAAPELPEWTLRRDRVAELLSAPARVVAVTAPAGYGKTLSVRSWVESDPLPTAWVGIDLLDDDPATFWRHVLHALGLVMPGITARPAPLLAERPIDLGAFVAALLAEIEHDGGRARLVLDGVDRLPAGVLVEALSLLVDRVGDRLQLVFVGRPGTSLPLERWRSTRWLNLLDADDLRHTPDEVAAVAVALDHSEVEELWLATEGWPVAVHHALRQVAEGSSARSVLDGLTAAMSGYVVAEALSSLSTAERDAAATLAVLDELDVERCRQLAGDDVVRHARRLRHRGLLSFSGGSQGMLRFHPIVREVLDEELRWHDPERYRALHRRASRLGSARGDLRGAHAHLMRAGDVVRAHALVVHPVVELVERGERLAAQQLLHTLPAAPRPDDPAFVLDLAAAWLVAGDLAAARRWCEQVTTPAPFSDAGLERRFHAVGSVLELLEGNLGGAMPHVRAYAQLGLGQEASPLEQWLAPAAARLALAVGHVDEAVAWAHHADDIAQVEVLRRVAVPGVWSAIALAQGRLDLACARVPDIIEAIGQLGDRPLDPIADALVTVGWCSLAQGRLSAAADLAARSVVNAEELGSLWHRLQAGLLAAECVRLRDGPSAAWEALGALRDRLGATSTSPDHALRHLDAAEARVLLVLGEVVAAQRLIGLLPDGPRRRVLEATGAAGREPGPVVEALLHDRVGWTPADWLESEVVLARASAPGEADERMAAALRLGASLGWVSPFLGHDDVTAGLIRRQHLERLHPLLAARWGAVGPEHSEEVVPVGGRLTPRELTILKLLPTHLSYAEIATHLHLSVNTVKSNLKTLYRKLGVTSRSEAVEAGARSGLTVRHR